MSVNIQAVAMAVAGVKAPDTNTSNIGGASNPEQNDGMHAVEQDESNNTSNDGNQTPSALLQDAEGKPLFPALFQWRTLSQQFLQQSSQTLQSKLSDTKEQRQKVSQHVSKAYQQSTSAVQQSSQQLRSALQSPQLQQSSQQLSRQVQQHTQQLSKAVQQSSHTLSSKYRQLWHVGQTIDTLYGSARVQRYDESTQIYTIQLSFGTLYTPYIPHQDTAQQHQSSSHSDTNNNNTRASQPKKKKTVPTVLELNSAYETWEKQRQKEIQAECLSLGLPCDESTFVCCFDCYKDHHQQQQQNTQQSEAKQPITATFQDANGNPLFPRLYQLRQSTQQALQKKQPTTMAKKATPCLLCVRHVCRNHSSAEFRPSGLTLCQHCVACLECHLDENCTLPEELQAHCENYIDLYRRASLLLQYSSQFLLATADQLEENKRQHHQIGVGGNSAGLVSGVLGVAAACTILTPAGPPLLAASLVFGGSATAVQTGSEAYQYYSEPTQLANRVLVLQGIAQRILAIVQEFKVTTLLPYLDQAVLAQQNISSASDELLSSGDRELQQDHNHRRVTAARAGTRIGSTAATSAAATLAVQEAALTGRFVSRATTAAARTARFARFAGGALSAATLVLEARELHSTVSQIKRGSPCEKAAALRTIYANRNKMPGVSYVEKLCHLYVKLRSKDLFCAAVVGAMESAPAEPALQHDLVLVEEVVTTLESVQGDEDSDWDTSSITCTTSSKNAAGIKLSSKSSLLERVQRFKEREARREQGLAKVDESSAWCQSERS